MLLCILKYPFKTKQSKITNNKKLPKMLTLIPLTLRKPIRVISQNNPITSTRPHTKIAQKIISLQNKSRQLWLSNQIALSQTQSQYFQDHWHHNMRFRPLSNYLHNFKNLCEPKSAAGLSMVFARFIALSGFGVWKKFIVKRLFCKH